jgi:hypothetical protein
VAAWCCAPIPAPTPRWRAEEPEPNVMERPPREPDAALLDYMMVRGGVGGGEATARRAVSGVATMQWRRTPAGERGA